MTFDLEQAISVVKPYRDKSSSYPRTANALRFINRYIYKSQAEFIFNETQNYEIIFFS